MSNHTSEFSLQTPVEVCGALENTKNLDIYSLSVFWSFVKAHLGKLDEERFLSLQKATTDAGRGQYNAGEIRKKTFFIEI